MGIGVPRWLTNLESSVVMAAAQVTAVTGIRSLAQELSNDTEAAKKKKKGVGIDITYPMHPLAMD